MASYNQWMGFSGASKCVVGQDSLVIINSLKGYLCRRRGASMGPPLLRRLRRWKSWVPRSARTSSGPASTSSWQRKPRRWVTFASSAFRGHFFVPQREREGFYGGCYKLYRHRHDLSRHCQYNQLTALRDLRCRFLCDLRIRSSLSLSSSSSAPNPGYVIGRPWH